MRASRRGLAVVAGIGTIALGLSACGGGGSGSGGSGNNSGGNSGTPVNGGTLKLLGAGGADDLDPTSASTTTANALGRGYARQLLTFPASTDVNVLTAPAPDVATEVPTKGNGGISSDGKTYTLKLRTGVMWSTTPARQVVAGDFVRAFKHMCNPVHTSGGLNYYQNTIEGMNAYCDAYLAQTNLTSNAAGIEKYENGHDISGVKALNDQTLQIKLTEPASDFTSLLSLSYTSAVPVEVYKYVPGTPDSFRHYPSAGPYMITGYDPGKSITMGKNPNWTKATDPIRNQHVDAVQVTEGQANFDPILQQMQSGTVDLSYDVSMSATAIAQLAAKNDPNMTVNGPPISNPYLVFNMHSPNQNKAMQNLKVRQAIQYAIDKVALGQTYGGPKYNTPLNGAVPPESIGYKDFDLYPTTDDRGDPAKCKQMLSEAGYSRGLTVIAAYRTSGNHPAIYQSYAQDLQKCGITVKGLPTAAADFYSQLLQKTANAKEGKWDIAAPGWSPDWYGNNGRTGIQPLFYGKGWTDGSSNFGGYQSATTDALIQKALAAADENTAKGYWEQANEQIMKDSAIVPFMSQKTPWYHAARVKNTIWMPSSQQYDITNLWLSNS